MLYDSNNDHSAFAVHEFLFGRSFCFVLFLAMFSDGTIILVAIKERSVFGTLKLRFADSLDTLSQCDLEMVSS